MSAVLRPVEPRDHAAVLALNDLYVELLSPMDELRLRELLGMVDRADVVDVNGAVAGFVFTFGPGSAYDSANYREFSTRFDADFYYLDRIAIDESFRRRGLASFVYDEVERVAAPYSRLTLEVNTEPPNEASLAFHARRGYLQVGALAVEGDKAVALMSKELG